MRSVPPAHLQMWAGVECTVNRVGDFTRDQLALSGHYARPDDIQRLSELGVKAVRYPVLWERHVNNSDAWKTTTHFVNALIDASIEPIIGLMHHGSGVDGATIVDDAFPEMLAAFATEVARRFPSVKMFTPVNEPLTTARFACLYGHWYPHQKSDRAFVTAFLNQIRATQRSMESIREVTAGAILVATEDLGHTHASASLQAQAHFENARKWLTWDLLCGHVDRGHPMWKYLSENGGDSQLARINAGAPESAQSMLIGVNHYLTSERYLDANVSHYPVETRGGNGRDEYVDVEVVRAWPEARRGTGSLLTETWHRYRCPLAITEAHLGCTREQQVQWLAEVWREAEIAQQNGADVRAVTAWSAFGSYDWDSLLTRENGHYEPGLFDVRAPTPRATAVAKLVKSLAMNECFDHPALDARPWWRMHEYENPDSKHDEIGIAVGKQAVARSRFAGRPLLVAGSHSPLIRSFHRLAQERGLHCISISEDGFDDVTHVAARLAKIRPWAVISAFEGVPPDRAAKGQEVSEESNAHRMAIMAQQCAMHDTQFVALSSDSVFNRSQNTPLSELDESSFFEAGSQRFELDSTASIANALTIRTATLFGDWESESFLTRTLRQLNAGETACASARRIVSPTYHTDLVHTTLDLLLDGECGLWHLTNTDVLSLYDFARMAAEIAHISTHCLRARPTLEFGQDATRSHYSALRSARSSIMPSLENALQRWVRARSWELTQS